MSPSIARFEGEHPMGGATIVTSSARHGQQDPLMGPGLRSRRYGWGLARSPCLMQELCEAYSRQLYTQSGKLVGEVVAKPMVVVQPGHAHRHYTREKRPGVYR